MPKSLVLSASSLDKFFTCPKQYQLSRQWQPTAKPSKELQLGTDVHAIMAGEKRITKATSADVRWHVKKMKELEEGYTIRVREVESIVTLTKGIKILRRIDALGDAPDGHEVIVDYKTTTYAWEDIHQRTYAKAEGFQSGCYLLGDDMPSRMDYLISAANGTTAIATVWDDVSRYSNLLNAARLVQEAVKTKNYPAHRGWLCRYCDFVGPCYDLPNWKSGYTPKEERQDD